ncbi:hypothetical protein MIND_00064700 [Mycena indigotica]|uniref:Uncharacterized protein n=1 Tax=Mycena indigotica TaxID=2126181 RepID=A0A8H6WE97_9AGAR|nr:uncharacterized protein MIND_00064700 [Mycena indigotica]KAF7315494.1 hypothetical protein MIND_00064700 [Mycena indigotica]
MNRPNHLRETISRFENVYVKPMKEYVKEAYTQSPFTTTVLVIFAASSITPIVSAVALAFFALCLSLAVCSLAILGIALSLAIVLSTTLVSSTALALVGLAIARRKSIFAARDTNNRGQDSEAIDSDSTPEAVKPRPRSFAHIFARLRPRAVHPQRRKLRLLLFIAGCEVISRLHFPRIIRYSFLYRTFLGPTLFGPWGQRGHPLQRLLSLPFFLTRRSVRILFPLLWSKPLIFFTLGAFILSGKLRRNLIRFTIRLGRTSYARFQQSELADALGSVPWKEYAATGLEHGEAMGRAMIASLVALLRALDDATAESRAGNAQDGPTATSQVSGPQDNDSTESYEMVPPAAEQTTSTLRARNTVQADGEEY